MHPGFGVYIHIPFCAKKCDYCAFATFTDRHQLTSDYLDAMRTHIRRSVANGMPKATSVFVGGGTPTLVPADELMSVLAEIKLANNAEVTVECNPDDITLPMMQTFLANGITYFFGVQWLWLWPLFTRSPKIPDQLFQLGATCCERIQKQLVHTSKSVASCSCQRPKTVFS